MNDSKSAEMHARTSRKTFPWRRLLREPLLHFFLLGALLFVGYDLMHGRQRGTGDRIVVDDGVVAGIVQRYTGVWQRPPTAEELRGLVDGYIRDEVFYREGVAMGLQDNDIVVRRRVQQKLEVMAEEYGRQGPATEADLRTYLADHGERYKLPAQVSFEQVMFDPSLHRGTLGRKISAALVQLNGGTQEVAGDSTMLPRREIRVTSDQVARDFGHAFAAEVASLPVGLWLGPVRSPYGEHLVRITERIAARAPRLSEVRVAVERDFEHDRRKKALDDFYRNARENYDVAVTARIPPFDHRVASK